MDLILSKKLKLQEVTLPIDLALIVHDFLLRRFINSENLGKRSLGSDFKKIIKSALDLISDNVVKLCLSLENSSAQLKWNLRAYDLLWHYIPWLI